MRRVRTSLSLVSSLSVLSLAGASLLASPATAATGAGQAPSLAVEETPRFLVGQQIGLSSGSTADQPMLPDWTDVRVSQHWAGSAPEGIDHYDSTQFFDDGSIGGGTGGLQTHAEYFNSDYQSEYGGGSAGNHWEVEVLDNSGDSADVIQPRWHMYVIQEDGHYPSDALFGPKSVTYTGTWKTLACECFSGGGFDESSFPGVYHKPQDRYTNAKGAAVTLTYDFARGDHVGVVMPKSTNRGRANVLIDGTPVATVNSNAATTRNRVVLWQRWMPAGVHKIKVVNQATPGHPRIDIDAFLVNGGAH